MTTEVIIAVKGNKAVQVDVMVPDLQENAPHATGATRAIKPGEFATVLIHGDAYIVAKEVGGFL